MAKRADEIDSLDKIGPEKIAAAVKELSPDEAMFFIAKLEGLMRKRKIQATGYLVAMVIGLLTMLLAFAYYGTHDGFVGWVFLVPCAVVAAIIWTFGYIANRVGAMHAEPMRPPGRKEKTP